MTDDPNSQRDIYSRFTDNRDYSVPVHFVGLRVLQENVDLPADFVLPEIINCCLAENESETDWGLNEYNIGEIEFRRLGINLLITNFLMVCNSQLIGGVVCPEGDCYTDAGFAPCRTGFMCISKYGCNSNYETMARTFLHELGHNVGLSCAGEGLHSDIPYNVLAAPGVTKGSDINRSQEPAYRFNIPYFQINYLP